MDINDAGWIAGDGTTRGKEAEPVFWRANLDTIDRVSDHIGRAYAIGDSGILVGYGYTPDRSEHAMSWIGSDEPIDLGVFQGRDSHARAISDNGSIAGLVGIDSNDRGQSKQRACVWIDGKLQVLTETLECVWTNAIDLNSRGERYHSGSFKADFVGRQRDS